MSNLIPLLVADRVAALEARSLRALELHKQQIAALTARVAALEAAAQACPVCGTETAAVAAWNRLRYEEATND